jgi:hypothetical protein
MSAESSVPADGLILAAIDRAYRHRRGPVDGVSRWDVVEHLGAGRRTKTARWVTRRLEEFTQNGVLERGKRHGIAFWRLTERGRRMLSAGDAGELPESPQHRRWRETHGDAAGQLERGRQALDRALGEAAGLLGAEPVASSDDWLLAGVRLYSACRRLAAATHCQYEWQEPDDAHADIDTGAAVPGRLVASQDEVGRIRALRVERRWLPHDE